MVRKLQIFHAIVEHLVGTACKDITVTCADFDNPAVVYPIVSDESQVVKAGVAV